MFHLSGWNFFLYMFHCSVEEWWFGYGVGRGVFQRWGERKKRNYFSFLLHLVPRVEKRITFIYMPIFQYICYAFCPKLTSIEIRVLQRFSHERSWHFPLVKWVYEAFGRIFQILCIMILREADKACSRSQHIWLGPPFHLWFWGTRSGSWCCNGSPWMWSRTIQFQPCFPTHLVHNLEQVASWCLDHFAMKWKVDCMILTLPPFLSSCDSISMTSWLSWPMLYSWARHPFRPKCRNS